MIVAFDTCLYTCREREDRGETQGHKDYRD